MRDSQRTCFTVHLDNGYSTRVTAGTVLQDEKGKIKKEDADVLIQCCYELAT